MGNPSCYRDIARRCHELLKSVKNPDVAAQLRQWVAECDPAADGNPRQSGSDDLLEQARRYRMRAEEYRVVAEQTSQPAARLSFQHLAESYEAMAGRLEDLVSKTARSRESTG